MQLADCVFCQQQEFIVENDLAGVFADIHPVQTGHLLIIPKQHYETFFDLPAATRNAMFDLVDQAKIYLNQKNHPDGYNIGINVGAVAGQTVMHCHVHLIPRYQGDMVHPEGGIRKLLPPSQG